MNVIAFIPIKLNSQRLPHKNILPIAGRPLCWHIVNSLLHVKDINKVFVYCSDEAVMQYLPQGVLFKKREKRLDEDCVKGFEIYQSFIEEEFADVYVLAHTTSPFIKTHTIENSLGHILAGDNDSAFSAERIQTFAWYNGKPINYDLTDVPRTQDMEPVWIETSGFYMFQRDVFVKHHRRIGFQPYIQEVSGIEALDIDEAKDFELAKVFWEKENGADETNSDFCAI